MDAQDLYWLAGLLEGEGHFTPGRQKVPYPAIHISMTDQDVIARVAHLFGSSVSYKHRRLNHWKDIYTTSISDKHAVLLMGALYPLMGIRRKEKIKDIVINYVAKYQLDFSLRTQGTWDTKLDIYWLAGLLEGEGSFLPGPPSDPNRPRIQLFMTDEDVVQSAAGLLGICVYSRSRGKYKRSYQCMLRGRRALDLMRELRPIMGQRRQQQIDRAISSYDPHASSTHNWSAKLDVKAVLDIYTRSLLGENQRTIAEEYRVDKSIVSCIKNGKLWSSVTGAKRK